MTLVLMLATHILFFCPDSYHALHALPPRSDHIDPQLMTNLEGGARTAGSIPDISTPDNLCPPDPYDDLFYIASIPHCVSHILGK